MRPKPARTHAASYSFLFFYFGIVASSYIPLFISFLSFSIVIDFLRLVLDFYFLVSCLYFHRITIFIYPSFSSNEIAIIRYQKRIFQYHASALFIMIFPELNTVRDQTPERERDTLASVYNIICIYIHRCVFFIHDSLTPGHSFSLIHAFHSKNSSSSSRPSAASRFLSRI